MGDNTPTRRQFALGLSATVLLPSPALAGKPQPKARALKLYNPNTKERFDRVFREGSRLLAATQDELNWFLRDHHEQIQTGMDPAVFDLMWRLAEWYRRRGKGRVTLNVHSAYRTKKTNEALRREGAAHNSRHLSGQAVDLTVQGYGRVFLARAALAARRGGMGLYAGGRWVHLDTGPSRYWHRRR
jgi:uncharacterized protein YcbK (DUF882 family)